MHILLSDIENCPAILKDLPAMFERYDKVVICYRKCNTNIQFSHLQSCINAYLTGKLQIVHIKNNNKIKNTADHAISFVAGNMIQYVGPDAKFDVCSKDSDLDNTVTILKSYGYKAKRITDCNLTEKTHDKKYDNFVLKCLKPASRPKNMKSLQKTISNFFNIIEKKEIDSILNQLSCNHLIEINGAEVSYNHKALGLRKARLSKQDEFVS